MNLTERAKGLKRDIPAVFLALKHPQTPILAKVLAAVTVGYALSPIDLIPDFIPLLGYLDDLILLPVLIAGAVRLIPRDVFEECRQSAENLGEKGAKKRWYYAIPILLVWAVVLYLILRAIL